METNKQFKRVPFTIELAKKIQSGEIEGRIVTLVYHEPVRIVCFDRNCDTEIIPCIALILDDNYEYIYKCNSDGLCIQVDDEDSSRYLAIELYEEETQADLCEEMWLASKKNHEFKPFDKVLVRDNPTQEWVCTLLSSVKDDGDYPIYLSICNYPWLECISYEGNEYLVGTTNKPK